ncbi:hypothetical protein CH63R_04534 [Colletotrichum higginsianum IMI 349063]|uniref:Uncharacterized protein n=1 Tax=Colletotrichum higginsianum (strain IMI 349063) TaxID=759273 RepID=A0A1B7YK54_COLHI|nr:hypothetical protein CH63R_04534 [Colletotrichum higginsianum IMI 349063]OBR12238.1 hypothetical protein CH63R_04534 [Colletotrichum higginsianum IMI 349063]
MTGSLDSPTRRPSSQFIFIAVQLSATDASNTSQHINIDLKPPSRSRTPNMILLVNTHASSIYSHATCPMQAATGIGLRKAANDPVPLWAANTLRIHVTKVEQETSPEALERVPLFITLKRKASVRFAQWPKAQESDSRWL